MTLSTIRSSENLFAMDIVASPEQPSVDQQQQSGNNNSNDADDTDKMVCHVDFVHLLQAAARLKKLLEVTAAYGNKNTNTSNHQANAKEIVEAVVGLYEEFLDHKKKNAPTIQRSVDSAIDSTIDQCLEILQKEIDWCVEIIKNNKKKRAAAQQEKDKASQQSTSPVKESRAAHPVTPNEQQVEAPKKKTVPQHVEEADEDVWERMVEAVSDSFEGHRDEIKKQAVGHSANDETDPLLLFANNWSDGTADQEMKPMDISNDDDLSVQILSTEQEEDPLVWFAEYWGAPEQQQEKNELISTADYFLEPAELQDAMMI